MASIQILLNNARELITKIYGNRLSKVLLYGSYARGEQTIDSDIDLMVVLKDTQLSVGKEIRLMNESLFELGFQNDLSISVHPVTENKFATEKSFFFNRVRSEAVEL